VTPLAGGLGSEKTIRSAPLLRKSIMDRPASIVRDGWPSSLFKTCASAARTKNVRDFRLLRVLRRINWMAIHAILKGMRSNNELRIDLLKE
jgi:hypothetical protein